MAHYDSNDYVKAVTIQLTLETHLGRLFKGEELIFMLIFFVLFLFCFKHIYSFT